MKLDIKRICDVELLIAWGSFVSKKGYLTKHLQFMLNWLCRLITVLSNFEIVRNFDEHVLDNKKGVLAQ